MEEMKDKLKPVRELVQKFINMEKLLCSLMLGEYPKVCVNLQTDVR